VPHVVIALAATLAAHVPGVSRGAPAAEQTPLTRSSASPLARYLTSWSRADD